MMSIRMASSDRAATGMVHEGSECGRRVQAHAGGMDGARLSASRRMTLLWAVAGLCMMQGMALAQVDTGGEEDVAIPFELIPPKGWVLDQEGGAERGAAAVFYPNGSTLNDAKAVISLSVRERKDGESLEKLMLADSVSHASEHPGTRITAAPSLRTVGGKTALIRHLAGGEKGDYRAAAYIDEPEGVIVMVLAAVSPEEFDASREAFEFLVGSFHIPR